MRRAGLVIETQQSPAGGATVTIVIPTYGQAHRVGEAIASALAQTYRDLEVLVMDDASPDETPKVTGRFTDPRLRVVRNPVNLGRVGNYREGLRRARGAWVLNLDGDDCLSDTEFVSAAMRHAAVDSGVVLVVGGNRYLQHDGRFRDRYPTSRAVEHSDGWTFFLRWRSPEQTVPHFASVYRADLARSIGFYTEDILSSDWDSLRRLCLVGRVVLLHRLAGVWHGHDSNASKAQNAEVHLANLRAIEGPYEQALRQGRDGWRLRLWHLDALQRYLAWYLGGVLTSGNMAAARAYERAFVRLVGKPTGIALIGLCWATRPSLWFKVLLSFGGPGLLGFVQRIWHRLTWSR